MSCRFILSKALSPKHLTPVPNANGRGFDRDVEFARFFSFLQRIRLNLSTRILIDLQFRNSVKDHDFTEFLKDPFLTIKLGRVDVLIELCDNFRLPLSTHLGSTSGDEFNCNFDGDNRSLLHVCCEKGDAYGAYVLLSRGASPNVEDIYGRTPIFLAALNGNVHCVRLLIAYGIDLSKRGKLGLAKGRDVLMYIDLIEVKRRKDVVDQCVDWIHIGRKIASGLNGLLPGIYIGEHRGTLRHGRGLFVNADSSVYLGDWREETTTLYRQTIQEVPSACNLPFPTRRNRTWQQINLGRMAYESHFCSL